MVTELPLNGGKSIIQYGRDFYTNWVNANPILQEGEVIIVYMKADHSEYRIKIGDGVRAWSNLPWRQPQVLDSLGQAIIPAASQRAITEGLERVEEILSLFNYQEKT